MKLRVTDNQVMARIQLEGGETFVLLDLDSGASYSPEVVFNRKSSDPVLAQLLAEVYHDLVTAVTVRGHRTRRLSTESITPQPPEGDEPSWIYIPRKIRIDDRDRNEPVRSEIATKRPPKPHPVIGYRRKGNMTDKQRDAVKAFEETYGVDVMSFVQPGETFVLPHVSPKEFRDQFDNLPLFIKIRFAGRLQQSIANAVDKTRDNLGE